MISPSEEAGKPKSLLVIAHIEADGSCLCTLAVCEQEFPTG
jgi:hypothetical protein